MSINQKGVAANQASAITQKTVTTFQSGSYSGYPIENGLKIDSESGFNLKNYSTTPLIESSKPNKQKDKLIFGGQSPNYSATNALLEGKKDFQNYNSSIPSAEETEAQCDELSNGKNYNTNFVNSGASIPKLGSSSPSNGKKLNDDIFEDQGLTSSLIKKPNFSVVCMLPSKQPRTVASVAKINKDSHQIIDKQTLQRILQLQSQYKETKMGGTYFDQNHKNDLIIGNHQQQTQNMHMTYGSPSKSIYQNQISQNQHKLPTLNMDKIGMCGIPSLWVPKEDLVKDKQLPQDVIQERERVDKILRILQIHKKYENEKYFGGQGIYKRGQASSNSSNITGGQGGQSFINPDFVQFSTEILIAKQKVKDETAKETAPTQNEGSQTQGQQVNPQVFPQIRNYDNPEQLLYKILFAEAKLIRMILESHGFLHTESNDWNLLWTCTSTQQKPYMYENLNENQKINHFVNSSELTRKDRLCFNVGKMQMKHGKGNFDFLPETYILPDEFSDFYKSFNQSQGSSEDEKQKNLWIIKPTASSQGKGIFMINELSEVPLNESLVISRYIPNPLLINGLKFDLRLYVLVTSFDPLKIYIYNEGLVRFASEPYDLQNSKQNVYAHLTNYSINKKSEYFVQNKNIAQRDFGNKWSLSALQTHLQNLGIDMKIVWERIYDAVIKSLLSIEHHVQAALKKIQNVNNTQNKSNSFDLFGFDIILDSDLKPWILEVNLSPSLAFDSPLDFHIKSNLIVDTFNIVGLKKFTRRKDFMGKQIKVQSNDQKKRYQSALNMSQQNGQNANQLNKTDGQGMTTNFIKQNQIIDNALTKNQFEGIDIVYVEKLSRISAKHRELLREHLEEFARNRKQNFTRIYPSPGCSYYDQFFEQPRALNKMLYKYLYQQNDLQDIISLINKSQLKSQTLIIPEPYNDNYLLNHNSSTQSFTKQEKHATQNHTYNDKEETQSKPQSSHKNLEIDLKQNRSSSISSIKKSLQSPKNEYKSVPMAVKVTDEKISVQENYPTMSPLQRKKYEEKRSITTNKKLEDEESSKLIKLNQVQNQSSFKVQKQENSYNKIASQALNMSKLSSNKNESSSSVIKEIDTDTTMQQNLTAKPTSSKEQALENNQSNLNSNEDKVIITGDDILIEYVRRVMQIVKVHQFDITTSSAKKLEQFLTHKVWYSKNHQNRQAENQQLWQRIEAKYIEMQERKRRLFIKKLIQQEGVASSQGDKLFLQNEKQKEDIIKDFTSNELEQMLIQSNKNNQIEVVSILLCGQNSILNGMIFTSGILTKIEKECSRLSKNSSQMLKFMKLSVDQSTISNVQEYNTSMQSSHNDNFYGSPKDSNSVDKSQILVRMRTSEDKIHQSYNSQPQQYYPFNYKSQQNTYDQLQSSYSHHKSSTSGSQTNQTLYQTSGAHSKQNLLQHKSGKKSSNGIEQKEADKKITLPLINNNHLSQDYSRVSIQVSNSNTQNGFPNQNGSNVAPLSQEDLQTKYRSRLSNEKNFVKQIRQQSLQSDQTISNSQITQSVGVAGVGFIGNHSKQSSLKIARNQANSKFERLEI